jgi:N-formylglutamate amidohydrolase
MDKIMSKKEHFPQEQEKQIETKIILEFMRHGKKEDDKTKTDEEIRLTEQGRVMAKEKGESLNPQAGVALAWGSPKKRTQETALHAMLPDISINQTLEEIEEFISKEQKYGKKLVVDERLSFEIDGPEGKEMIEAFKAGRYLQYLVNESDRRAIDLKDEISSTYSRFAGNIAEIIHRYSVIGNNFNNIASKKDDYEKFGNQLERYLGSHQGVVEGFVAKVLEETEGNEKRDEFINSLGSGFTETEGIRVEVVNTGKDQKIIINYKINEQNKSLEISKELLEKIIKDRHEFEKKIVKKTNNQENLENRFKEVLCPLVLLKEQGFKPLKPLQKYEGNEILPENFIGTNLKPLENADCPNAFVMMPHSGEYAPKNLYGRLTKEGVKSAAKIDAGTHIISNSEKIPSVWPKIARLCGFDLNRRPFGESDSPSAPGSMVWKELLAGFPIYKEGEEPSSEETAYLSHEYHKKYYDKIDEIIDKISMRDEKKEQRILSIDLHSFPDSKSNHREISEIWKKYLTPEQLLEIQKNKPLFVLSDRNGLSCDDDIKQSFATAIKNNFDNYLNKQERSMILANTQSKEIVAVEKYLPAGGYNAEFANKKRKENFSNLNMIQVEMSELAYVDFIDGYDDAQYDFEKLKIMQKLLEKSILDVDIILKKPKK